MGAKQLCARFIALAMVFVMAAVAASGDDGWRDGRATFYGGPGDPWPIHRGSCGYGYLDPNSATGWDVCAAADTNPDYSGSCGRCYEVKCSDGTVHDNYGQSFDRNSMCYDPDASVIVQTVDTCPCSYPSNAYSNRRWCCGDNYHLDISIMAFERLADIKWGVVNIKVRQVDCHSRPSKPAYLPLGKSPSGDGGVSRPSGWSDRRPF